MALDTSPLDARADTAPDGGQPLGIFTLDAARAAVRQADEWLQAQGERQRHMRLPARVFGECEGALNRRGGSHWTDLPDELPLGEEEGRAIEVINWWLKDESLSPSRA